MSDDAVEVADVPAGPPLLRIVRGLPADADGSLEVAVLTAVLASRTGGATEPSAPPPTGWAQRETQLRRPLSPGPHGWWASRLPR